MVRFRCVAYSRIPMTWQPCDILWFRIRCFCLDLDPDLVFKFFLDTGSDFFLDSDPFFPRSGFGSCLEKSWIRIRSISALTRNSGYAPENLIFADFLKMLRLMPGLWPGACGGWLAWTALTPVHIFYAPAPNPPPSPPLTRLFWWPAWPLNMVVESAGGC